MKKLALVKEIGGECESTAGVSVLGYAEKKSGCTLIYEAIAFSFSCFRGDSLWESDVLVLLKVTGDHELSTTFS